MIVYHVMMVIILKTIQPAIVVVRNVQNVHLQMNLPALNAMKDIS